MERLRTNLSRSFQSNYKNLKAKELVRDNYIINVNDYNDGIHEILDNMNETLLGWIADQDVDEEEMYNLLKNIFHKKPQIIKYIKSIVSNDQIKFIELVELISRKKLESNEIKSAKLNILLTFLLSPPEQPDDIF